jgi:hypothetical protein
MDRGTVVGYQANQLEVIRADQALFTSIRSPMGEGYRIVAASPGVRPEERSEITRWSPSHGSLCSDEPCAEGISSYPVPTGRQCIAHSRYGGTEHTARGGQRVLTHAILIAKQDFAQLSSNPLRVWAAVPPLVEPGPDDRFPPHLPLLNLEPDPHQVLAGGGLVGLEPEVLCAICSQLTAGQRLVVRGARRPFAALEWALMLLPVGLRAKISVTAGIRVSPSRPVGLAWVEPDAGETARAIMGQDIQLIDLLQQPAEMEMNPPEWFSLLRRWWRERRWDEICLLTNRLTARVSPVDLVRVAAIVQAIDDAAVADAPRLQQYKTTWQRIKPGSEVERDLIVQLGQVIDARYRALERQGFAPKGQACGSTPPAPPRTAKIGAG